MCCIEIEFQDDKSAHKDIVVKIKKAEWIKRFDSYYFLIEKDPNSTDQVPKRLKSLLKWWVSKIEALTLGKETYLPIDFSDQYLGCFKVKVTSEKLIKIEYGFTQNVMGYSITPSFPEAFEDDITNFIVDINIRSFLFEKEKFINSIDLLLN